VLPLLELTDPIGVLSIYVDADPALAGGERPAWQTPVRDGLRRILGEARETWPRADRMALQRRLDDLEPELESFLDRGGPGRGRALFATVAGGETHRIDLRAPVPPAVVLARRAVVVPLLAPLQDGRAAGVVDLARERLVRSEWELGDLRELATAEVTPPERPGRGRPATNPAVPQPFPERDVFETAAGARVLARVQEEGADLAGDADVRGWDMVVADGDPRLLGALAAGFEPSSTRLVRSPRPFAGATAAETAERIAATLHDLRSAEAARLVERLDDTGAATRDRAAVERALAEGRVDRLLLPRPVGPARPDDGDEELVRRAFATGAVVTVVDLPPASLGSGGIAAFLRW
jgi:hypothetical protein